MPIPPPSPTDLRSLTIAPGQFCAWFHAHGKEYAAFLDHGMAEVEVHAATANPEARIELVGQDLGREGSAKLALQPGINRIPLTVRAEGQPDRVIMLKLVRHLPAPDWKLVAADRPFPARDSAGELVFDNQLWLLGGYIPKVISDVWRSGDGVQWTQMPDVPATLGINIPLRWCFQGKMWIASQKGELLCSSDGQSWTLVTDSAPWVGRKNAGSVVFRDRLWVIGGAVGDQRLSDVWSSPDGKQWTLETAQAAWAPRHLWDNVVVHRNRIWVIGGGVQRYHPSKSYRDVWSSPDGKQWDLVTDEAPWIGRQWGSCITYRDRLWVLGGYRSEPKWTNLNDVWWSEDGQSWHELKTPTIWSPRHELSPYVLGGKLWVVAGNSWPLQNDVWQLDIPGLMFLTQPPLEDFAGSEYRYRAVADFHEGGGTLSYRLLQGPAWLSVDGRGMVSGRVPAEPASHEVTLEARSARGETATQHWTLAILP